MLNCMQNKKIKKKQFFLYIESWLDCDINKFWKNKMHHEGLILFDW